MTRFEVGDRFEAVHSGGFKTTMLGQRGWVLAVESEGAKSYRVRFDGEVGWRLILESNMKLLSVVDLIGGIYAEPQAPMMENEPG